MLQLNGIHHIAIICSDYPVSKDFYTRILGLTVMQETYRPDRNSYKLDLALNGKQTIELFSFDDVPPRVSYPEAAGLRHLAFEVDHLEDVCHYLKEQDISYEEVRRDELTGKQFLFISDPDELPIEFYEK